jgi:uncharacterized protein YecE (DUF72 family)
VNFLIGCAVWAYKAWIGEFYPIGSRAGEFLHLYSQRFHTVEGNTTFYAVPSPETVTRWNTETPESFKFCLKLPRDITHQGLLNPHLPKALAFCERVQPLGKHLGPIFAQLPPSYTPQSLDDLSTFLTNWREQTDVDLALEVRHLDWFQEPHITNLTTLLEQLKIGRVLLDTRPIYSGDDDPQLASERRKPKVPLQFIVTAPFILIRFISHPNLEINKLFLQEWAIQIQQWLQEGKQIYFFVHCPLEEKSPANARYFQSLLEEIGVNVPPLPWNNLGNAGNQLSLW